MIRLIVALDSKRGIARNGKQPWKIPSDERYFMEQTKHYGGLVIMGRKTFDVIRHPLAGRMNVVLSRQTLEIAPDVIVINDLKRYLRALTTDAWIIGGAEIYKQTLGAADEIYVTQIDEDFSCDQFFPVYTPEFRLATKSSVRTENGHSFRFNVYKKSTAGDSDDFLLNEYL